MQKFDWDVYVRRSTLRVVSIIRGIQVSWRPQLLLYVAVSLVCTINLSGFRHELYILYNAITIKSMLLSMYLFSKVKLSVYLMASEFPSSMHYVEWRSGISFFAGWLQSGSMRPSTKRGIPFSSYSNISNILLNVMTYTLMTVSKTSWYFLNVCGPLYIFISIHKARCLQ